MANPPPNNPSTPLNTRAEALIQGYGMNNQRRDVRRGGGRYGNRGDGIDARGRQGQEDVQHPNDERRRHQPGNQRTHHLRQADNNAPPGQQFVPTRANGNAGSTTVNGTASNNRVTRAATHRAPINTTRDIANSNRTVGEETKGDSPMHTRSGLPFQMRDNRGGDASRGDNNRRRHQTNSPSSTHLPSAQERDYTVAANMSSAMIRSEMGRTSNQPSSGPTDAAASSALVNRDMTYSNDMANDIQRQPTRLVAHRGNLVQSGGQQGQSRSNASGRIQQEQIRQSNATAPTQRGSRTSHDHIHIARVDREQGGIAQRGYVDREQGGIAQRGAGVESVTSVSQILHNENSIASASPLPSYRQAFDSNPVADSVFDEINIPPIEDDYGVRVMPVYDDVTFYDEEEQGDGVSISRVDTRVGNNRHMARVIRNQNDRISSMERNLNMFAAQITNQLEDIISEINQGSTRHRQNASPMPSNQPLPSPDHTSGTIDPHERIPVHLAPSIEHFHGQEMTTSPVMFVVNDEVYWRYTSDIFQAVRIMEVEAPTMIRRQPVYHVMLLNNDQEHDVRHDELFISSSRASILDPQGVLMANSIDLSAMDRMNLAAMDNQATPRQIQLWSAMDTNNLKLSDLISSMKEITLPSDSLVAAKNAYAQISMALLAATRGKVDLPTLTELSPMISIRSLMVPPTTYPKYAIAMSFYQAVCQVISNQISNESFAKAAPKARSCLRTVINGEKDGIDQLYHLLKNIFPFLGAFGFDPTEVINALVATDGMQIEAFIEQALDIESQLKLAGVPIQPNQLIKRFFAQLMRSSTFQPLLATKNHIFQEEMRLSGNKQEYTQESISSLSSYILRGNPPTTIAIQATSNGLPRDLSVLPPQQSQRSTRFNKSPFNKKIYAAMGSLRQGIIEDARIEHEGDEDDATVYDEADDKFDAKYFTEEGQRDLISTITPILKSLNIDVEQIPEELFQDLILAAISGIRDHDKNCEVCNGRHDADRCRARGINFLHPTLRKAVEQYNAIHGDKPKNPPLPLTPPTARFGDKKFKAMAITSLSVEDSKEDLDASTQSVLTEGNGTAQVANERGGVATIRDNATEQHHSDTSRSADILPTSDSFSAHPHTATARTEPTGTLPVSHEELASNYYDPGRKMTSSTCDCCELSDDNFTATSDSVTSSSLHALTNLSANSESKLILRSANAKISEDNDVPFDESMSAESKTLDHSAQIDNVLNVVSKELEQSINSGNISITPQYGLIDLPKGNSDTEPTIASIDEKERRIEDVLQTADYAVYNEQVNC